MVLQYMKTYKNFAVIRQVCAFTGLLSIRGSNMAEYLDFFNIYILGVMETFFQLYFLAKILKKKMWTPFLFPVCSRCSDYKRVYS